MRATIGGLVAVLLLLAAPAARAEAPPADAPPTVRFTGIFNGSVLSLGQPTVLTAITQDDKGIAQVRFLRDFTTLAVDTTAPYQAVYTPTTPDRAELLTAEATDTAGQVTEFSIAVQVPRPPAPAEDRPPAIVLDSPAADALIPARGIRLAARAEDDRGVTFVRFLHGARTVCDDRTAPYRCTFRPEAFEVGRLTTFTAVASDTVGQTQGAIRDNRVERYRPMAMTLSAGGARRGRFAVSGRVKLPDAITVSRGCTGGKVRVRVRRGGRTVAIVSTILDSTCRYRTAIAVRGGGRVRLTASFQGNALVGTKDARSIVRRAG